MGEATRCHGVGARLQHVSLLPELDGHLARDHVYRLVVVVVDMQRRDAGPRWNRYLHHVVLAVRLLAGRPDDDILRSR